MSSYRETNDLPRNMGQPVMPAEARGDSEAARTWRPLVEPGMYVAGIAGETIGQVKEVRAGDFLVDQWAAPGPERGEPVYVPFERIHEMLGDRITLDVPGSNLDQITTRRSPFRPA